MKSQSATIITALCVILLSSCSNPAEKEMEYVRKTTEKFFTYAQSGDKDSLLLLYPNLDFKIISISTDSITINKISNVPDGGYEVSLTNYFSYDNTEESNIKTNITLYYEKVDSGFPEYVIKDSRGLVERSTLPKYMEASGCIKPNQKYTDKEYSTRYAIADTLLQMRAEAIAKQLAENMYFEETDYDLSWYPIAGGVEFELTNNTEYDCNGFTVYISVDYANVNNGNWVKKKHRGDLSKHFDTYLAAHSTKKYDIVFDGKTTKLAKLGENEYYDRTRFFLSKIEVCPEAVMGNIESFFTGTEYDEYIKLRE
jgi:hypothetical protein